MIVNHCAAHADALHFLIPPNPIMCPYSSALAKERFRQAGGHDPWLGANTIVDSRAVEDTGQ